MDHPLLIDFYSKHYKLEGYQEALELKPGGRFFSTVNQERVYVGPLAQERKCHLNVRFHSGGEAFLDQVALVPGQLYAVRPLTAWSEILETGKVSPEEGGEERERAPVLTQRAYVPGSVKGYDIHGREVPVREEGVQKVEGAGKGLFRLTYQPQLILFLEACRIEADSESLKSTISFSFIEK